MPNLENGYILINKIDFESLNQRAYDLIQSLDYEPSRVMYCWQCIDHATDPTKGFMRVEVRLTTDIMPTDPVFSDYANSILSREEAISAGMYIEEFINP